MSAADGKRNLFDEIYQKIGARYLFILMFGITIGMGGYSCLIKQNTEVVIVDTDIKSIQIEQTEADKAVAAGFQKQETYIKETCDKLAASVQDAVASKKHIVFIHTEMTATEDDIVECLERRGYIVAGQWHRTYIDLSKYYE